MPTRDRRKNSSRDRCKQKRVRVPELHIGQSEMPGSPQQQQQREVAVFFLRSCHSIINLLGLPKTNVLWDLIDRSRLLEHQIWGRRILTCFWGAAETLALGSVYVIIVYDWASITSGFSTPSYPLDRHKNICIVLGRTSFTA